MAEKSKIRGEYVFLASAFMVVFLMTLNHFFGPHIERLHTLLLATTPLIPLYFGWKVTKYFGFGSDQGKSTFFMTLSMFFSFLGWAFWYFSDSSPTSLGHIFFILLRPSFALAIYYSLKILEPPLMTRWKQALVSFMLIAGVGFVYFNIFKINFHGPYSIARSIAIAYSLADLFLLAFALYAAYVSIKMFAGSYSKSWIALSFGAISFWISQIHYTLNNETYRIGSAFDMGWCAGYILFALSFILLRDKAEEVINRFSVKKNASKKRKN